MAECLFIKADEVVKMLGVTEYWNDNRRDILGILADIRFWRTL